MITKQVNEKLMEMIENYAVGESLRGMFIGQEDVVNAKRQESFSLQRKQQIQTFLNNITQNQAEN